MCENTKFLSCGDCKSVLIRLPGDFPGAHRPHAAGGLVAAGHRGGGCPGDRRDSEELASDNARPGWGLNGTYIQIAPGPGIEKGRRAASAATRLPRHPWISGLVDPGR